MVGAHLLESQPTASILEHLLHDLYQLIGFKIVARLPGPVLNSIVLPCGMYLFLQWCHSVDQSVGNHADSSQAESFQLADSAGQGSHD
jgi:hypothetical protein